MRQEDLRKVQHIQLQMALEVKRICNLYDIEYFIIAGTLLGAVRHSGFIPWDDDMDIGMLRNDYDRFLNVCKNELSNEYFLQTWDSDDGFGIPIAKIRKNGTKFIEQISAKTGMHNGIYIDIFPFDNVPEGIIKQRVQDMNTYILKRLILSRIGCEPWLNGGKFKKIIFKFIKAISLLIPLNKQKQLLNKQMKKYNRSKTSKVVTFGGAYGYKKETIKRKWLESLTTIQFEGESFSCPTDYKNYLSYFYGDYMTPPPEDKRYNRHGIIEIDLGCEYSSLNK